MNAPYLESPTGRDRKLQDDSLMLASPRRLGDKHVEPIARSEEHAQQCPCSDGESRNMDGTNIPKLECFLTFSIERSSIEVGAIVVT